MIKLLVTDVDGTIVGKDEILHDEFVSYVSTLRAHGIEYTIATGRTLTLAETYVKKLKLDIPYIACNGGTIAKAGEVLVHKTVPLLNLRKIFEKADAMGMSLLYSIDGTEYAYRQTDYVKEQCRLYGRYEKARPISEEEWLSASVEKVIVMAAVRDGSIGEIENMCRVLPKPFGYKRYANKAIDILHSMATKECGVRTLAKMMNISMDEVLFVGDDLNDICLMKEAGLGVAVGNAQPEAKEAADYIANEKTYLGVIEAVDKFTGINGMKQAFDNSLRRQSYSLPGLLNEMFDDLKIQTRMLVKKIQMKNIERIILTGCGDSYCAGLTLKYELEKITKIETELVTAIDFSAFYESQHLSSKVLVIVISISGNGVRIKECMEKAKHGGAKTLAVTRHRISDIGDLADDILELKIPSFENGPGNRTYFASVLALLLFGIGAGYDRNVISEYEIIHYESEIKRQADILKKLLPKIDDELFEMAKVWKDKEGFDFVGSGMDYGSSWFGHAKAIEITGAFSMHINAEEWFHMNNFVKKIKDCGTVMIVSKASKGFSRTCEAIKYAARIGRPLLVVTDASPEDFDNVSAHYIQIEHSDFTAAMALTQYVPFCVMAGYMGAMLGENNCRGCLGSWSFAAGGKFIRNSESIKDF